jgi:hypothetical protein
MSIETMERDIQQLKATVADLQADLRCAEQMIEHLMTCASSGEPLRPVDFRPRAQPEPARDAPVATHIDGPLQPELAGVPTD